MHSQLEQLFESITAEREERSLQAKWEEVAREGLTKRCVLAQLVAVYAHG